MLKVIINTLLFGLIILLPGALWAESLKIGVVDLARVLEESPQAEAARSALEQEFAPKEREIIKLQKDIRNVDERLMRDGAIMSDGERAKLERQIIAKKRDMKRSQEEFRDDLNFKRNEVLEKLQRQVVSTIRAFAKEKKYDLLLAEGVIFMSDKVDTTEQVLQRLKSDMSESKP